MMSTDNIKSRQGFTLIEVVLTLAIGGLIFLLAFLAFSQVSANRRDTVRRQDARRVLALAEEYAASKGNYPCYEASAAGCFNVHATNIPSWENEFKPEYLDKSNLGQTWTGGSEHRYYYTYTSIYNSESSDYFLNGPTFPAGTIVYWGGAGCSGAKLDPTLRSSSSEVAVWIKLEKGGYCVSNT